MSTEQKLIEELEKLLIPYAVQRFDFRNAPQAALIRSMPLLGKVASAAQNRLTNLVTWLARAFIRTLVYAKSPMFLRDIATVALGEALYMLNYPPYNFTPDDEGAKADLKVTAETEIHRWFLFLIESGKLPGRYQRYTGIYDPRG
ncbi:MAG: hypothetical protein ACTSYD_04445 [Candidatus Heimdallarchaeaceae archaeon]